MSFLGISNALNTVGTIAGGLGNKLTGSATTGATAGNFSSLGSSGTDSVQSGANQSLVNSAGMVNAGMQASSGMTTMQFFQNLMDALNKLMQSVGRSIKDAVS